MAEGHRAPNNILVRRQIALVLLVLLAAAVFLTDLYLVPGGALPAPPYAVAMLVAAYLLSPAVVAGFTFCVLVLHSLAYWLQESSLSWEHALSIVGAALIGCLSYTISRKMQRVVASREQLQTQNERLSTQVKMLQEQSDEAASQADEQLRTLSRAVEQSPSSVVITDTNGNIEYVNPKFIELTGYSLAEAIGKNPRLLKAQGTSPEEYQRMWKAITGGREWRGEFHNKKKNGELYWEAASISPVRNSAGVITHFVAVKEDITEHKRMMEALQKERDFTSAIVETVGSLVVVMDRNARIVRFNKTCERITGYSAEEVAGKPFWDILIVPEEMDALKGVFAEVTAGAFPNTYENFWVARDGSRRLIAWSNTALLDEHGMVEYVIGTGIDITERHEFDRLKDQFIAVAAHELKTPVAIMKGYSQALLRTAEHISPPARRMLDAIDRGSDRIDNVVHDLLDISKLHEGSLELTVETIDLPALAAGIADRIALTTDKHRIRLVQAEPVVVRGDRDRIEQVLANLLGNAVKYSPKGGDIDVAVAVNDREAVVSVKDKGVGIPKDSQTRIFQRFYSAHTDTPFDYGGMGVGLHISKEIVKRHGGRMWFESQEGEGTTFYFTLPLGQSL